MAIRKKTHSPTRNTGALESGVSIAKALNVLRAFVDGQERWGVRELAVAVGQPRSTVHRLLLRLRHDGFLEYDEAQQKYRIGFEFMRLSSAVYVRHGPRQVAQPIMRELAERCGESVWFALYSPGEFRVAYVAEQESCHTLRHPAPIGRDESLVDGACGFAILASLSQVELEAARRALTLRSPADLDARLKVVRAAGYAVVQTREVESAVTIAAAVRDAQDSPIGSIAVVVPMHRFDAARESAFGAMVIDAARRVSYRLGAKLLGGASAGSWHDAVALISELLRREAPRLEITPALGGGGQNLEDLDRGFGSFALTTATSLSDAVLGRGQFTRRHNRLRALMNLSELHLHVITHPDIQIGSIANFARLRVSPGEQSFSSAQVFDDMLRSANVSRQRFEREGGLLVYLDFPEAARQFEARRIDALVWLVGMPNPIVQSIESKTASRLAPLLEATLQRLRRSNPGYRQGMIPVSSYPQWLRDELPTVVVPTVLVSTADCPDDQAYEVVRTIFENRNELALMSSVYRRIDAKFVQPDMIAPTHPGALRYFREVEAKARKVTGKDGRV